LSTLLIQDPVFAEHAVPTGHPERPDRIRAIEKALSAPLFADLIRIGAPPAATADVLATAHSAAYVSEILAAVPDEGIVQLEADTYLCPQSFEIAARAAAAACLAVDRVMTGSVANAFCAIRPPGHHAEPDHPMGFCLFNNAVIAARHAQRAHGAERIAIVDWDVHHGNGTQAIVWDDPSILYCSTHQMPLYPGTGSPSETGCGNIVNVPLAAEAGSTEFEIAFDDTILPAIDAFQPDLIVISAGFDAHWRDPLAQINLSEEDFVKATLALMEAARRHCGGRIVSLLEGGYDLAGLSGSVAMHVATLMKA
jgi:acetoin utilization deacetylase AcuC-like enzyme